MNTEYTQKSKSAAMNDECDYVQLYFDEIARTPLLSFEEEKELSRRIAQGDEAAQHALVKANLLLVVKIAKHFVTKEYQLMDVIQDGNLGLIKAAERYDYRREVRFSTYASWWIKQSIVRSLSLKKRMIRLPHRKEEKLRHLRKAWNTLNQDLGHAPSSEELAEEMLMDVQAVEALLSLTQPVVSFENSLADSDGVLFHLLEDNAFSPDEMVFSESLRKEMAAALESLAPKEKKVLDERFGFASDQKSTLKKMGDNLGISAETVRQIEMRALQKIRGRHAHLKEYLCQ
jgi:RNA polymerase primary sigma factor